MTNQSDRVIKRWSDQAADTSGFSSAVYWQALPEVRAYVNRRGTGGTENATWVDYCLEVHLSGKLPVENMLSIGCGTGGLERELAARKSFQYCDAVDISPTAIEIARQTAHEAGYTNISYQAADANVLQLPPKHYDVVWFSGSLHHIEALEHVYLEVASTLKPDGWLFFNEYVGPSRFNFTHRQKNVIAAMYALIPERYRRSFVPGAPLYPEAPPIPDPKEVAAVDPSEAVRSAEIMPLLDKYFKVMKRHNVGGTILQFLLSGIAGNFAGDDPDAKRVLQALITLEETLIDIGDLDSDFVIVAAQAK